MGKAVKATQKGYYGGKIRVEGETFIIDDPEQFSEEWMEDPNAPVEEEEPWSEGFGAVEVEVVPLQHGIESITIPVEAYAPPDGLTADNLTVEHIHDFVAAYHPNAKEDELTAKGFVKKDVIAREMGFEISSKLYGLYMNQADAVGNQQAT